MSRSCLEKMHWSRSSSADPELFPQRAKKRASRSGETSAAIFSRYTPRRAFSMAASLISVAKTCTGT